MLIIEIGILKSAVETKLAPVFDILKDTWNTAWETLKTLLSLKLSEVIEIFNGVDWYGLGSNMIIGIANGVSAGASALIDAIRQLCIDAFNAAMDFLDEGSPSRLFMKIGKNISLGMANGIMSAAGEVVSAAASVAMGAQIGVANVTAGGSAMGAVSSPTTIMNSTSQATTNNYNLTVNSQANAISVKNQYEMLKALG